MIKRSFRAAFPQTLPILAGFLFLGFSYGVYANVSGFSFLYPTLTALLIYGGSLEFVVISMLTEPFAPLQTFLAALIIQARHLFYGIAMLEKFRGTGKKKPYLIFGMCDEAFSINYSAVIPPDVDRGWFMFFVTLLNQAYWVFGAAFGGKISGFTVKSTLLLIYLALISAVAYSLWSILLKYNPVSKVAVCGFMTPVFGYALSSLFASEGQKMGAIGVVALLLVVLGMIIVNRSPSAARSDKNLLQ